MIKEMSVRNFKCFDDMALNLGALTLLSGLNGAGKSTLIQSLLLLRQSYDHGLLPDVGLSLNGSLVEIGEGRDALFEGADIEEIGFRISTSVDANHEWEFAYDRNSDVLKLKSIPIPITSIDSGLFTDNFSYLSAERMGPRVSYPTADYLVRLHRHLGKFGEFSSQFLLEFEKEHVLNDLLLHPKADSNTLLDQAESWMGEISPGARFHFKRLTKTDLISMTYSFAMDSYVGNEYRSTNVGFGLSYSLSIILAILSAKPGSLILVENPEAHLHPRGQMLMGQLLAKTAAKGVQVITETHSDHVLNGIRLSVYYSDIDPAEIKLPYFERCTVNGKLVSTVQFPVIDSNARINPWPSGFFDQNDIALLELMMPKKA